MKPLALLAVALFGMLSNLVDYKFVSLGLQLGYHRRNIAEVVFGCDFPAHCCPIQSFLSLLSNRRTIFSAESS